MEQIFDLAIIGGGPGGYVAAERAGAEGLNVVLFERKSLGGVCLNEGCIPTKTLLYSAKVYDYAQHADRYGVSVEAPALDFGAVLKRKEKVVRKLVAGVKAQMKGAGVEVVAAGAQIRGKSAQTVLGELLSAIDAFLENESNVSDNEMERIEQR